MRCAVRDISKLSLWCLFLFSFSLAQPQEKQPDTIARIKSGEFSSADIENLAKAGAVQAIPILRDAFVDNQDPITKGKIASALVRLGNKDEIYWDFLISQATAAVDSEAPSQFVFDSKGKLARGASPEFLAWAKSHNRSPQAAGEDALYWTPIRVLLLGSTGDPRAIPLLRRALSSNNYLVQAAGARGLAEIDDKESIPLIIGACERAPADVVKALAEPLVYFDDAQAQSAVNKYLPKEEATALRKIRADGKRPF